MQYMPATLIERRKETWPSGLTVEVVIWAVAPPVAGSSHGYKYRLYAGRNGRTLVRYDNEAGKGDHKHVGPDEHAADYTFVSVPRLIRDFLADIEALGGF